MQENVLHLANDISYTGLLSIKHLNTTEQSRILVIEKNVLMVLPGGVPNRTTGRCGGLL